MTGVKETPTNFRVYYGSMKDAYTQKKENNITNLNNLRVEIRRLYDSVVLDFNNNREEFNIDLNDFEEFYFNKYINGKFLRTAKGIAINRDGNYELIGRNFDVYNLAKLQKDIYDIEEDIKFCDIMLSLTIKDYKEIVKEFYTKVQEKLIIDGCGYVFDNNIGWICINRCHIKNVRPHIDYKATKERKKALLEEGKRLYNKEEAEWCEKNGIEYKAEDGRVYQKLEYVYEIPLLDCRLTNGRDIKFQTADYRGRSVRGKTNNDILEESGHNIYNICKYDIDIRTKLYICLEADKILYTKFIRNENQEASTVKQTNR